MNFCWILKLQFAVLCYHNTSADYAEATSRSAVNHSIISSWNTHTFATHKLRLLAFDTKETDPVDNGYAANRRRPQVGVATYIYAFLGIVLVLGGGSVLVYCHQQRRAERFVGHDNANNNMQRHSLLDSFVEDEEWQCSVCYHDNHPAKKECIMCGTPQVISQQAVPSPANQATSSMTFNLSPSAQNLLVARQRSFHVRRLNEMNLNQRQRGARRRNLWRREKTADSQFRWVRDEDCLPPRISILTADAMVRSRASSMTDSFADTAYVYPDKSEKTPPRNTGDTTETSDQKEGCVETELTMLDTSPSIRKHKKSTKIDAPKALAASGSTANASQNGNTYINESSVGYVRHVDKHGNIAWVPAESITHEPDPIDTTEFPRCSTVIDFEAVAALPFRQKVRWLLQELEKIAISWEDGHLLLKIRRDAVLDESMRLLMLVPASDLRQRLRIEFIEEPGLDAGGLMREWVTLLCEQLFDESYGLFQATHVENLSYWINPNSGQIHPDHLISYQFTGRLIAKCLLEGQLLTVYFALPFLKHLLGVPISFSDLEFLDEDLYRSACWLRDNSKVDSLCLDFTMQRRDAQGDLITEELKPDGKNIVVNDENKQEYLELLVKYKMFDTVHEQVNAILQGLYDIIPRTLLAVFDYQELELLLCGVPSIDVEDWQSHTDVKYQEIDQPNRREKKAVEWFWEVVSSFSQEKRARLLQFATGSSRVPVEGFKALLSSDGRVRRFGIHLVTCGTPPAGLFPQAHTCFNRIDLPIYESKEQLETYLTLVINMEITGFSMQ